MGKTLLTVVFPIILGAIVIALFATLKRKVMKDGVISPLQCLILLFASATGIFGATYLLLWGFTLPDMLPGAWTAVMCGATVNIFVQYFNMKAASIDKGEVSFTAPLQAMTPGLISGLAILLGEYPSKIGMMGIILMATGSYILLWEKAPQRWYEYFGPLKRLLLFLKLGRLNKEERNKTLVVALALGSACMGTMGLLFDGLYTRRALTMQGLVLVSMGLVTLLLLVYLIWYIIRPDAKPTQKLKFYRYIRRSTFVSIIILGVLWVAHIFLIQPVFKQSFVAYVGTLKRFHILFSVILGFLLFKEKDFKKRILVAILIVAGAMLIATDDLPAKLSAKIAGLGL